MGSVLAVGIATLDIINEVDGFPAEDSEVRALSQQLRRGGNATNTLVVLSQLGHRSHWAGCLAQDAHAHAITADLAHYRVDTRYCQIIAPGHTPTSYITLNRRNGSRTIVHYRDLPEYAASHFKALPLNKFDWLHLEGRNIPECLIMLEHALAFHPNLGISLEVEKPRPNIESLFPLAPLMLISRHYATARGFSDPEQVLSHVRRQAPSADIVCAWGEQGAWVETAQGERYFAPAQIPPITVDTLAAGDTFNAGIIHSRLHQASWPQTLNFAVRLAGYKCGRHGLDGLGELAKSLPLAETVESTQF